MTVTEFVLTVLAVEWVLWCVLTYAIKDTPRCPVCGKTFLWAQVRLVEVQVYGDQRVRLLVKKPSFPCPHCQQVIGVPSYRRAALRFLYFAFLLGFLALFFELSPPDGLSDLVTEYVGSLLAAVGGVRIVDWSVWRRLEPGSPSPFT